MRKIPSDSQIRTKLDAVEPVMFHPMFADIVAELEQSGGLEAMRCLDGRVLIALDGIEFHCSDKVHCSNCSHRKRGKSGKIENEGFNVLKTKGYNLEHNFGHGKRNLSMVLAVLNLLASALSYRL